MSQEGAVACTSTILAENSSGLWTRAHFSWNSILLLLLLRRADAISAGRHESLPLGLWRRLSSLKSLGVQCNFLEN